MPAPPANPPVTACFLTPLCSPCRELTLSQAPLSPTHNNGSTYLRSVRVTVPESTRFLAPGNNRRPVQGPNPLISNRTTSPAFTNSDRTDPRSNTEHSSSDGSFYAPPPSQQVRARTENSAHLVTGDLSPSRSNSVDELYASRSPPLPRPQPESDAHLTNGNLGPDSPNSDNELYAPRSPRRSPQLEGLMKGNVNRGPAVEDSSTEASGGSSIKASTDAAGGRLTAGVDTRCRGSSLSNSELTMQAFQRLSSIPSPVFTTNGCPGSPVSIAVHPGSPKSPGSPWSPYSPPLSPHSPDSPLPIASNYSNSISPDFPYPPWYPGLPQVPPSPPLAQSPTAIVDADQKNLASPSPHPPRYIQYPDAPHYPLPPGSWSSRPSSTYSGPSGDRRDSPSPHYSPPPSRSPPSSPCDDSTIPSSSDSPIDPSLSSTSPSSPTPSRSSFSRTCSPFPKSPERTSYSPTRPLPTSSIFISRTYHVTPATNTSHNWGFDPPISPPVVVAAGAAAAAAAAATASLLPIVTHASRNGVWTRARLSRLLRWLLIHCTARLEPLLLTRLLAGRVDVHFLVWLWRVLQRVRITLSLGPVDMGVGLLR
ncbi:hypothetical protein K461DRAFT_293672 [Myriangium duriaei CBS 260.36]|uniref:Uncharacterized protein n=1 Tax=Myriangium duriaei CBS 260.36 TaxID=1168546 RepID=A0A9P4J4Q4_9PEZI|nr:hypothetical protein K461DRAFT_293672 [Myriangium duriaei CBS 260.36]